MLTVTDGNKNISESQYDALNQAFKQINATGCETLTEYNAMNRLTKVTLHRIDALHNDEAQIVKVDGNNNSMYYTC